MTMQPGTYRAKVTQLYYSESAQKKTPCMVAVIDLGLNTSRNVSFWLTDANWEYAEPDLRRLGWNGETKQGAVAWDQQTEHEWDMEIEMYAPEGKAPRPQERWRLGGKGPKPMDAPADKASLFKARYTQAGPPPATRPAMTPTPPPARPAASPPPTKPPEAAPIAPVIDKATAWAAVNANSQLEPDEVQASWFSAINRVEQENGRKEDRFTPADWVAVAQAATPF